MYNAAMDSQLQPSTSIATTKAPHSQLSAQATTISLVGIHLFLGTAATPTKHTWICSSSPSAILTTFRPSSTPSNKTLAVESTVDHHMVRYLEVGMIYASTPTPTKTSTATPASQQTTLTPLEKQRTPSLVQSIS